MSRFEPESYLRYRIDYPEACFRLLRPLLGPSLIRGGLQVLDLGAGTGFSVGSFIRFFPARRLILVDPDEAMLRGAHWIQEQTSAEVQYCISPAETLPQGVEGDLNLVLAGSSWHWMQADLALDQVRRVLKPGGVFLVFEYQFPRLPGNSEIQEWIRREFNLRWKPEGQRPRGSLRELTEPIRASEFFSQVAQAQAQWSSEVSLEELLGVIGSQSRFLAYEQSLSPGERSRERERVRESLSEKWGPLPRIEASYSMEAYAFSKRWV